MTNYEVMLDKEVRAFQNNCVRVEATSYSWANNFLTFYDSNSIVAQFARHHVIGITLINTSEDN